MAFHLFAALLWYIVATDVVDIDYVNLAFDLAQETGFRLLLCAIFSVLSSV